MKSLVTKTPLLAAVIALGVSGFAIRRLDAPGWMHATVEVGWVLVCLCIVWLVFREWRSGEVEFSASDRTETVFVYLRNACLAGLATVLLYLLAWWLWSGEYILDGGGNLAWTAELFFKAILIGLAVLWIPFLLFGLATSEIGLTAIFVAAFSLVIAVPCAATLLAADFLFSASLTFTAWTQLLLLVLPASLATVILFDFLLDALIPRSIRIRIQSEPSFKIGETVARGLFVALMLVVASRLVPDAAGVSVGAAFAAGMAASFVRFYLGLYLDDSGDAGLLAEEFAEDLD